MCSDGGWIDDDSWQYIQDHMPITCVDFIPVKRNRDGRIEKIGLILRETPFDGRQLWCHLGGRVHIGESLADALTRHATSTLEGDPVQFSNDPRSLAVMEWFPHKLNPDRARDDPWHRFGEDPVSMLSAFVLL